MKTICNILILSLLVILENFAIAETTHQETTVNKLSTFKDALREADPGDVIIIQNGTYQGWDKVTIAQSGISGSPITIRAESPGNVVFRGNDNEFIITGAFIVLDGLKFQDRNGQDGSAKGVIWLNGAQHSRITNCTFDRISGPELIYIGRSGEPHEPDDNRIDHCIFTNNGSRLLHIQNNPDRGQGRRTQIDHNIFRNNHYAQGDNLGSLIRVGNWEGYSYFSTGHLIESNTFQDSDTDGDLFHFKASGITIRANRFENTNHISFRQGENHVVEGNLFVNTKESGSGAVRITGKGGHKVINNVFIDGPNSRIAIGLEYGNSDKTLADVHYITPRNNVIANNTIYGYDDTGIYVGTKKGSNSTISGKRNDPPRDNTIVNNIIVSTHGTLLRLNGASDNLVSNNLFHATGAARVGNPGDNPLYGDPGFQSVATANFRLLPNSLALDHGIPVPQVATDFDGHKRPANGAHDIGAFELVDKVQKELFPPRNVRVISTLSP